MAKAAINAVYVDYKRIKGRKMHQIIFEVPSEQWPEFYKVLGEPDIEISQWFGIAKMDAKEPAPTPEDNGTNLTANAAIMLGEGSFQKYLEYRLGDQRLPFQTPDEMLKYFLAIESKKELNTNPVMAQRWRVLRSEYQAWMQAA